jgi:hypothetical protein
MLSLVQPGYASVERRLAERAAKDGKSVEALTSELIEQAVARRTFVRAMDQAP